MTKQYSLITLFLLAIFPCLGYSQLQNPLSSSSIEETDQIVFVDSGRTIDTIKLVSPTREPLAKDYLRTHTSAAGIKTYFLKVNLGFGDNHFTVVTYLRSVRNNIWDLTIRREQPDTTPENAANVQSDPVSSPVAINQNSSSVEIQPVAVTSQPARATVPVAYFSPNNGDTDRVRLLVNQNSLTAQPPLAKSFVPTGRAAPAVPLPAPPQSADQNVKDSENKNIPINPNHRLIFGFEQVGASSATSKGRPFVDLLLNIPVGRLSVDYKHKKRADCIVIDKDDCKTPIRRYFANSFWTGFKLTSSPNQTLPDLGGLTSPAISGFFGSNQSGQINDLVQAFEMKIGWETSLRPNFSFIAGVGATSPLTSEKTVVAYKIPRLANGDVQPEFKKIFGPDLDFMGIDNLILTSGDRDRFMRNWFAGFRLRHQLIPNKVDEVYPAVFELTYGQDEVLTNKLISRILKFDTFVPISIKGINFLYFGASFSSKLTRKVNTTTFPFFLEPATTINIFANNNLIRNIRDIRELNSDRDIFSFRFGVDLLQILNRGYKQKETAMQDAERPKQGF